MRGFVCLTLAGLLALSLFAVPTAPNALAAPVAFSVQAGGGTPDDAVQAFAFFPGTITIDVGDSITWSTGSGEPHTISFGTPPFNPEVSDQVYAPAGGAGYDGSGFTSSGILLPSTSYTLSFTKEGRYTYRCLFHQPAMTGTVVVQPAGAPYPLAPGAYQPASDPQLKATIQTGAAALAARHIATQRNADGTTTYKLDAGAGDGHSFGLMRYGADDLAIHAGDTVVWTQPDPDEIHTVTFLNAGQDVPFVFQKSDGSLGTNPQAATPAGGKAYAGQGFFNSGILAPGQQYALTFSTAGLYRYHCLVHDDEGMKATITVLAPGDPSSASAPVAFSGSASGTLVGTSGGAFHYYQLPSPSGAALTLTLNASPFSAGQAHAVGLAVYQSGQRLASATEQATGLGDARNSSAASVTATPSAGAPVLIQVFNYGSDRVGYTLTAGP